jgi:MbtH protein
MNGLTIDGDIFKVLVNTEGQYSLWPAKKPAPEGWHETSFTGSKADCAVYVDENWKDMRPLSLQKAMSNNH